MVLDIDPRNGGSASFERMLGAFGSLPETWSVATGGGGRHLYFRASADGLKTSHGKVFGSGIDVQGDGSYVVAPPSRHASGRYYRWERGRNPDSILADLPKAHRRAIKGEAPALRRISQPVSSGSDILEGGRNSHLTSLAGRLVASGVKGPSLRTALAAENTGLRSPLLDTEVQKIVDSVSRYEVNDEGDEAERIADALLHDRFTEGGQRLLIHASDGQFWHFESTHWQPTPVKWLEQTVLAFVKTWPRRKAVNTTGLIRQVVTLLGALAATKDDLLRFNADPPPVINCLNGELWLRRNGTFRLKPHTPASYLRHVLAVTYEPGARSPRYDKAVAEIFSRAPEPKAVIRLWHELAGYAVQTARSIPLVVICKGGGSNGKTALLETLVRLIGRELVAAMPVEDLDKSRFTVGGLLGKQLFLDDDVKSGTKLPDGNLKRLSEAKTVTGEHKFGAQFTFTVRTVPILLCNNPPSLSDLTHGMRRRLLVIPFDRTFEEEEIDRDLFPGIWRSEMSGILNRCLDGLVRVINNNWQLSLPQAVKAAKDSWLIEANPLPAFIDECCERVGSSFVEDLYRAYTEWAQSRGVTMVQQRTSFDRNLESCGYRFGKKGNRGKRVEGLTLLKLD